MAESETATWQARKKVAESETRTSSQGLEQVADPETRIWQVLQ